MKGTPLYNAVELAANMLGQEIVAFHRLNDTYDGDFTVEDIARLSHIPCRQVVLDNDIGKDLFGTYIVFDAETDEPGVLVQSGRNHLLYRQDKPVERVTTLTGHGLSQRAYVMYEPLPENEVGSRELFRYFLRGCSCGDSKWFILFGMISLFVGILLPVVTRLFYDYMLPRDDVSLIAQILTVVFGCILAGYVFSIASDTFLYRMMSRGEYRMKAALLDRVFRLPPEVYDRYDSSDLTARAVELPEMLREAMTTIFKACFGLLFSVFYIVSMFRIRVGVTLVALACLAVMTIVLLVLSNRQKKRAIYIKDQETKSQSFLFQIIGGISRLRISGAEHQALDAYMDMYEKPIKKRIRSERTRGFAYIIQLISSSVILWMLILFVYNDEYTVGEYAAFTTLFGMLSTAVFYALEQIMSVYSQRPVFDRAQVILQNLPESGSSILVPKPFVGRVKVENVFFSYQGLEKPVLNGISFEVMPGEYIGVVGASGCGKSTLMKLLLGFMKPDEGKILYDGLDLEYLDKPELRRRMGVVLQEGMLIAGTVAENVAVTKPDASDEEIMDVLDQVGMSEDICRMPMGLQTILSEMSETVSGGQRQRLLIARAIIAGPRVLLMDEATSALDNRSQSKVTEALAKLNMTRIVIAHRLSTIRECDRILVLENGVITQMGTYDELMTQDGFFRKLAERQLA